ncbi:CBS domain-containing protein, partial [Streptomyces sviceus ATCC 29083]
MPSPRGSGCGPPLTRRECRAPGLAVPPASRRPSGIGRYSMTTAGDIMHRGAQWIPAHETLDRAAQLMRELGVGALPISDENERLCGILTDRDIVIGC